MNSRVHRLIYDAEEKSDTFLPRCMQYRRGLAMRIPSISQTRAL